MVKKKVKIDWKRLTVKAVEDCLKKTIELILLALILGAAWKIVLITVPAFTIGTVTAKLAKILYLDN